MYTEKQNPFPFSSSPVDFIRRISIFKFIKLGWLILFHLQYSRAYDKSRHKKYYSAKRRNLAFNLFNPVNDIN